MKHQRNSNHGQMIFNDTRMIVCLVIFHSFLFSKVLLVKKSLRVTVSPNGRKKEEDHLHIMLA